MTSWEKKHVRQKRRRRPSRRPALRITVGNKSMMDVITTSMATNCTEKRWVRISTFPYVKLFFHKEFINRTSYLCVQTQENEHDKETDGPQLGKRHHGYSLWVCNECQAWTWKTPILHLSLSICLFFFFLFSILHHWLCEVKVIYIQMAMQWKCHS